MNLGRIFQSKAKAFNETLLTNDIDRMRMLMKKRSGFDFLIEIMKGSSQEHMSRDMVKVFINEIDAKVLKNWNLRDSAKEHVLDMLLIHAIRNKRADLVEEFISSGMNFNRDSGLASSLVSSDIPSAMKLPLLRKMLSNGHDKIPDPDGLVLAAVTANFIEGVDFFATIGFNIHKDNEQYLRAAAKAGLKDMAQHLVEKYSADTGLAIKTSRELGNLDQALFIEALKPVAPVAAAAPATVESLSAEVKELREAVRELTMLVHEMRALNAVAAPAPKVP